MATENLPPAPTERVHPNTKSELAELKRVQIAMLEAWKRAEDESGEAFMPTGVYHGIKFE